MVDERLSVIFDKALKFDELTEAAKTEPQVEDYPDEDDFAEAYGSWFSMMIGKLNQLHAQKEDE